MSHVVVYIDEQTREYRGVRIPWKGLEELPAQTAEIDRRFSGSHHLGGDRLSHSSYAPELRATKQETELEFQRRVVKLATENGWLAYHTHDSRRSAAGFPDLVLAKDGRVLFLELKSATGGVKRAQSEWIKHTNGYAFWPDQWDDLVPLLSGRDEEGRA